METEGISSSLWPQGSLWLLCLGLQLHTEHGFQRSPPSKIHPPPLLLVLKVKTHLSNQRKFKQGRISLLHAIDTQHMPLIGLMNSCYERKAYGLMAYSEPTGAENGQPCEPGWHPWSSAARHPFPPRHKHRLSGCDRLGTVLGAGNTAANTTSSCTLAARVLLRRSHQSIIHQLARCLQMLLREQWAWRGPREGSSSSPQA